MHSKLHFGFEPPGLGRSPFFGGRLCTLKERLILWRQLAKPAPRPRASHFKGLLLFAACPSWHDLPRCRTVRDSSARFFFKFPSPWQMDLHKRALVCRVPVGNCATRSMVDIRLPRTGPSRTTDHTRIRTFLQGYHIVIRIWVIVYSQKSSAVKHPDPQ